MILVKDMRMDPKALQMTLFTSIKEHDKSTQTIYVKW